MKTYIIIGLIIMWIKVLLLMFMNLVLNAKFKHNSFLLLEFIIVIFLWPLDLLCIIMTFVNRKANKRVDKYMDDELEEGP